MKGKRLDNLTIIQLLRAGQQDALGRAAQILRQCAIRQRFCQMQPSDLFRAVEIGERAGDTQHAVIAARRELHGFGSVAQRNG
jgi:hypothetical protein